MVESVTSSESLFNGRVYGALRRLYSVSTMAAREFHDSYYGGAKLYFEQVQDLPRQARVQMFDIHMNALDLTERVQDKLVELQAKALLVEAEVHAKTLVGARILTTPADPVVLYRSIEHSTINVPGMLLDSHIPMHDRCIIAYWLFMKLCSYAGNPLWYLIPNSGANNLVRNAGKQLLRTAVNPREELPVTVYKTVVLGEAVLDKGIDFGKKSARKIVHIARRLYEEPMELLCDVIEGGFERLDAGYRAAKWVYKGVNRVVDAVPPLSYIKENAISAGEMVIEPIIKLDEYLTRNEEIQLPQKFLSTEYRSAGRRRINF